MVQKLQSIPKKIMEWWNKFDTKQKTIIVSVVLGVIVMLALVVTLLAKPKYTVLAVCENTRETAQIRDLLDGEGLTYRISDDGLTISIKDSELSSANVLLGANNIPSQDYSNISSVTDGGFSTTEADKQKKYKEFLQSKMARDLETLAVVDKATVQLNMPENDGTLLSKNEDSSASVMLTLNGEMSRDSAAGLAKFVKTALGNATSESVFIIDSNGNVLFSGEDDTSLAGNARNQLEVKQQYETRVKQEVEQAVLGTSLFDSVKVIPNLELDFSETTRTNHRYSAQEGMEQGLYSHRETYSSESTGGMTAAPPGTDANDTTYVTEDGAGGSSTYTEEKADYLPDESIENVNDPGGRIVYEQSTIAVVATKHVVQREDDLERQGLLDGISFAQYQAENDDRVKQEVDAELITMVSRATGIPEANVSIIAYDVPFFVESEGGPISATDILQIVLIVLILALLGFVVFRSMRADKATEEPVEELSVEQLLATTQEQSEVPDFELDKKSEVAEMIEKFVDENPEAVANLLRNWLTEDWG